MQLFCNLSSCCIPTITATGLPVDAGYLPGVSALRFPAYRDTGLLAGLGQQQPFRMHLSEVQEFPSARGWEATMDQNTIVWCEHVREASLECSVFKCEMFGCFWKQTLLWRYAAALLGVTTKVVIPTATKDGLCPWFWCNRASHPRHVCCCCLPYQLCQQADVADHKCEHRPP